MFWWGVDLGVRSCHLAAITPDGLTTYSFIVEKSTRWQELQNLARLFAEKIQFVDQVFVEEPPLAGTKNVRTALQLSQVCGAVVAASPAKTYLVPVSSWKAEVIGRGGADKQAVAAWLAEHHPDWHRHANGDQNVVDAICLALYGKKLNDTPYSGEDQ